MGPPNLIAHRGYACRFPENTLESLAAAVRGGARYVEFDVQLTADRVPVVCHDAGLLRTTAIDRCVHDLTYSELKTLSAHEPQRLGDRFAGVTIPSLAGACQLVTAAPGVTGFVEIKKESTARFGPDVVVRAVLDVLSGPDDKERFVPISYDPEALRSFREAGWTRVGWVMRRWDEPTRLAVQRFRPDYLFCNIRKVPQGDRPFWTGPWRWAVYEVDDAEMALAWSRRGAEFIETFRICDLLKDRRLATNGAPDAGT